MWVHTTTMTKTLLLVPLLMAPMACFADAQQRPVHQDECSCFDFPVQIREFKIHGTKMPAVPVYEVPHVADLDINSEMLANQGQVTVEYVEETEVPFEGKFFRTIEIGNVIIQTDNDTRPPFNKHKHLKRFANFTVDTLVLDEMHKQGGMCAPVKITVRLHPFSHLSKCFSPKGLDRCATQQALRNKALAAASVATREPCPMLTANVETVLGADVCASESALTEQEDLLSKYVDNRMFCNAPQDKITMNVTVTNAGGATMPAGSTVRIAQLDTAKLADVTCAYKAFVKSVVHGSTNPLLSSVGTAQLKSTLVAMGVSKDLLDDKLVDRVMNNNNMGELLKLLMQSQSEFDDVIAVEEYAEENTRRRRRRRHAAASPRHPALSDEARAFAKHMSDLSKFDLLSAPVAVHRNLPKLAPGDTVQVPVEVPMAYLNLVNDVCAQDGLPPVMLLVQANVDDKWSGVGSVANWMSTKNAGEFADSARLVGVRFKCAKLRVGECTVSHHRAEDDTMGVELFDVEDETLGPGDEFEVKCAVKNEGKLGCGQTSLRARTALGSAVVCEQVVRELNPGEETHVTLVCKRVDALPQCSQEMAVGGLWLSLDDDAVCLSEKDVSDGRLAELETDLKDELKTIAISKKRGGGGVFSRLFGGGRRRRRLLNDGVAAASSLLRQFIRHGGGKASDGATVPAHVKVIAMEKQCNHLAKLAVIAQRVEIQGKRMEYYANLRAKDEPHIFGQPLWNNVVIPHSVSAEHADDPLTMNVTVSVENRGDAITLSPFKVSAVSVDLGTSATETVMPIMVPGDLQTVTLTLPMPPRSSWFADCRTPHRVRVVVDSENEAKARRDLEAVAEYSFFARPACVDVSFGSNGISLLKEKEENAAADDDDDDDLEAEGRLLDGLRERAEKRRAERARTAVPAARPQRKKRGGAAKATRRKSKRSKSTNPSTTPKSLAAPPKESKQTSMLTHMLPHAEILKASTCDAVNAAVSIVNTGIAPVSAGELHVLWTTQAAGEEERLMIAPVPSSLAAGMSAEVIHRIGMPRPKIDGDEEEEKKTDACGGMPSRVKVQAALYRARPGTIEKFAASEVKDASELLDRFVLVDDGSLVSVSTRVEWDASCCESQK
ncbi:hypothetical protein PPROV_000418000 [Pycnococcus provasolii]|uniref:Uncharacterized protein n=1 Tax=Pycnococcus provasolii TaxID=41880 RepID=A0A830HJG4_9CHLO|nr:hypothetical protein PPROV_000418000 [Pycnococcus provasolii]